MKTVKKLTAQQSVRVRFGEVDSMNIVWHGNYLKYFEEGRETFSRQYGFNYIHLAEEGYIMPVIDVQIQYIKPLRYGDTALVETTWIDTEAAKAVFEYRIRNAADGSLCCRGRTTQVFLNSERQLEFTYPPYVQAWREQWIPDEETQPVS